MFILLIKNLMNFSILTFLKLIPRNCVLITFLKFASAYKRILEVLTLETIEFYPFDFLIYQHV